MKRRIHAALHRLQSTPIPTPGLEACIRRTLFILLFLASTTPARRLGRTDVPRLARRLRAALVAAKAEGSSGATTAASAGMHPRLLVWMIITGLAAAREGQDAELVQWFRKRAVVITVRVCGATPSREQVCGVLGAYLSFRSVHEGAVGEVCGDGWARAVREVG